MRIEFAEKDGFDHGGGERGALSRVLQSSPSYMLVVGRAIEVRLAWVRRFENLWSVRLLSYWRCQRLHWTMVALVTTTLLLMSGYWSDVHSNNV